MRQIPTINELNESIEADLRSKLNLSDDDLKKVLSAFSAVLAAQLKLLHLYLSDIQNNIFPDTADLLENGGTLERLGLINLGRNPNPATVGVFELTVTGVVGSTLRSGLTFKSNDTAKNGGKVYILETEYILVPGVNVVEVRALGNGSEFDLNVSDELTITEPVIGVDQTAIVSTVITQPTAPEPVENYRKAILDAIQLEPQGGARTDYRLWAKDAAGVQEVYPYVKENNAGVVNVYVEATEQDSIDGKGTPSASLLADVLEVLELDPDETKPLNERGRRPIQAIIETLPIVLVPVDVTIINLAENSAAITTSISNNLEVFLKTVRPYISGADLPRNKNDVLFSGKLQSVVTDVLNASNFFSSFEMRVNGVLLNSFEFGGANIPYLRNLIFV
ncbi:baseplate J/gp47 family protein [Tenacibaculum finnmarkense]|uniref:baseplate J/gp47 family protein n=1 Tax=Tenacibaculum finnmarkense TaxID=2781243 RepID=UPI00207A4B7A|nr:baseplate J/gp47 family protein [Tenacibaculum finnmarkense]MCM8906779.1 baseplate J/gp47 family protein [Tenacibaculum finnmarkense genomovar finnmarkense]